LIIAYEFYKIGVLTLFTSFLTVTYVSTHWNLASGLNIPGMCISTLVDAGIA